MKPARRIEQEPQTSIVRSPASNHETGQKTSTISGAEYGIIVLLAETMKNKPYGLYVVVDPAFGDRLREIPVGVLSGLRTPRLTALPTRRSEKSATLRAILSASAHSRSIQPHSQRIG